MQDKDKRETKQSQESRPEPHPKNGHLRLPNYIVERLAKLRLNGTQWQILWAVWRHTLCWQQPGEWRNRPYPISIDDLVDDTGINEYQLKRELGHLIEMNIIHRDNTPGGRGHKPITAFNLDPHTWNVSLNGSEKATLKERVADMTPFTEQKGSEIATPTMEEVEEKGSELVTPSVADSLPFTNRSATLSKAKSKLPKETLNKHTKETGVETTPPKKRGTKSKPYQVEAGIFLDLVEEREDTKIINRGKAIRAVRAIFSKYPETTPGKLYQCFAWLRDNDPFLHNKEPPAIISFMPDKFPAWLAGKLQGIGGERYGRPKPKQGRVKPIKYISGSGPAGPEDTEGMP